MTEFIKKAEMIAKAFLVFVFLILAIIFILTSIFGGKKGSDNEVVTVAATPITWDNFEYQMQEQSRGEVIRVRINQNMSSTAQPNDKIVLIDINAVQLSSIKSTYFFMLQDIEKMLKTMQPLHEISSVVFFFHLPLVDIYNNELDVIVLKLGFDGNTIRMINFFGFDAFNLINLANQHFQHPALDH